MKTAPSEARILVATDNVDDAQLILRQLKADFEHVRVSTRAERSVEDFEEFQPQVLVLAFDSLEKAERYYLGLYRRGASMPQHSHRAVILCHKDEVRAAFELCKQATFDDYVLYWPHTHDGPRLAMSIWIACREMTAMQPRAPRPADLFVHAKHLAELETVLDRQFADGALPRAEPLAGWAHELQSQLAPALAGTRELAAQVRNMRAVVLVVEDDELTRKLIARTLDASAWELVFAGDAASALGMLRRMRPDLILMDIRLPGLDGLALTRQIKANPGLAAIPIIMMTGDARRETLLQAMDAGAAEFVVKPFTVESLTGKLGKVLPR